MTTPPVPMVPPEMHADLLGKFMWIIEHFPELPTDRQTAFNTLLQGFAEIDEEAAKLSAVIRDSIYRVHGITL